MAGTGRVLEMFNTGAKETCRAVVIAGIEIEHPRLFSTAAASAGHPPGTRIQSLRDSVKDFSASEIRRCANCADPITFSRRHNCRVAVDIKRKIS